jgi:hypothetical protein
LQEEAGSHFKRDEIKIMKTTKNERKSEGEIGNRPVFCSSEIDDEPLLAVNG